MLRALLLVATLASAPFQCASDPDPDKRMEDTAPEALMRLAHRFEEEGNSAAHKTTLEQLAKEYPSSREGKQARATLGTAPSSQDE